MNERSVIKLHHLGIMGLTTTDNRSTRVSHQTEIRHLLGRRAGIITFVPLKSGDDYIPFGFQFIDLLCEVWEITRCSARLIIGGRWEAANIRFIAANEG